MSPNNDPFGDIDRQRDEATGHSSSGSSWETIPQARHRKEKGSNATLWIVIALCAGVLVFCCICCGGFYSIGLSDFGPDVEERLRDNPVILEHIGEIESCKYNFVENGNSDDPDITIYDIKGSKGHGQVRIVTEEMLDGEGLTSGVLILPDGTEIDLPLEEEGLEREQFEEEAGDAADGINDPPEAIPNGSDTEPEPDQQQ